MKPQRVQLKRTKGWRMPENTMKVDRSTKFGNPFIPGQAAKVFLPGLMVKDIRHAYVLYKSCAPLNEKLVAAARAELAGKNLACWCPTPHEMYQEDECHAAVLLKIANERKYTDMNFKPSTSATASTDIQNNSLADVLAAQEILRSFPMPKQVKSITFNNPGLIKFIHAARIDHQLLNENLGFTWDGVPCVLVPEQLEEYKINY